MNIAALFHRSLDNWCYPLDSNTLHIRIQTALGDVASVQLVAGDPFEWKDKSWVTQTQALRLCGSDGVHAFWETFYTPPFRRAKYHFLVQGVDGTQHVLNERGALGVDVAQDRHRNAFVYPYLNEPDVFRAPAWAEGTVWYQIFPERFRNGDPSLSPAGALPWHQGPVTNREFYGGDLRGILEKIDHLEDLGVGGIYLTPVFASPSVHKYDTTDYYSIDPAFGTTEDLKALVSACHQRGIRVLLDAVFNHAGTRFFAWQDVLARGRDSSYASWFHVHDWEHLDQGQGYETFAFSKGMPKLNTANPEVKDYLIRVALHWIRETGIDGWRLDVSNEIDHEFWRAFRLAIKAAAPEAYIVGEVWHDSQRWLRGDQYDAVMNYRYGNAVSDFVLGVNRMHAAVDFVHAVDAIDASYTLPVLRSAFNILDSHDTDRFLTRCGGDKARARLGWLLLFLLRGAPCVYYGSEVGLPGGHDPDNRRCMPWHEEGQDREQYAFLQALIRFRRDYAALLARGERRWTTDERDAHRLSLSVTHEGQTLVATLVRDSRVVSWPTTGHEILASSGPWAYRIERA